MIQGARRASAAAATTAGPRPGSTALLPPGPPPRRTSARRGRGGGRAGAATEALVPRSVVEPCVTCGICGGLLRDATTFPECLDASAFPTPFADVSVLAAGAGYGDGLLSSSPKCICDKLAKENIKCCPTCGIHLGRAPLEKLRSVIFPSKRRKVATVKKTKEKNLAPVGTDALSRIRCRDFYSACSLSAETGALIVWQPPLILEEMVALNQLAPMQIFGPPATSDTEYQRQAPTAQMTNTSVVAGSSFHSRMTVQDDENFRGDILTLLNESNARIMGRYDAYINQFKAENSKLIEELENEKANNQALMSDIQEKSDELATLKYYCDMFESDKTYLENQNEHLSKELEYMKEVQERYVRQVKDVLAEYRDPQLKVQSQILWVPNKAQVFLSSERLVKYSVWWNPENPLKRYTLSLPKTLSNMESLKLFVRDLLVS
ncbi:uncharacterized protein C2845_PM03G21730 [Panicum miliaceum]|uniref:Uncharacterized protein n=1 Tax=Panicum miliaceum TaxID=4540 RepID=A0A3L6TEA1_PANMI|nr:uncharacterized protein C2845_PM03G21730 [Panicum miliaceum]